MVPKTIKRFASLGFLTVLSSYLVSSSQALDIPVVPSIPYANPVNPQTEENLPRKEEVNPKKKNDEGKTKLDLESRFDSGYYKYIGKEDPRDLSRIALKTFQMKIENRFLNPPDLVSRYMALFNGRSQQSFYDFSVSSTKDAVKDGALDVAMKWADVNITPSINVEEAGLIGRWVSFFMPTLEERAIASPLETKAGPLGTIAGDDKRWKTSYDLFTANPNFSLVYCPDHATKINLVISSRRGAHLTGSVNLGGGFYTYGGVEMGELQANLKRLEFQGYDTNPLVFGGITKTETFTNGDGIPIRTLNASFGFVWRIHTSNLHLSQDNNSSELSNRDKSPWSFIAGLSYQF